LLRLGAEESTCSRNSHTHFHPRTRRSRNEIEHTLESTELFIISKDYRDGPSTFARPTARSKLVFNNCDSRRRGNRSSYFGNQEGNTGPGITI